MILRNIKILTRVLVLLAFIYIAVFGLLPFSHPAGAMEIPMSNCPYAVGSFSVCGDSFAHIKNWSQFSNVTLSSFAFLILLLFAVALTFLTRKSLLQEEYSTEWKYYLFSNNLKKYPNRIIEWLTLFEQSPNLSV